MEGSQDKISKLITCKAGFTFIGICKVKLRTNSLHLLFPYTKLNSPPKLNFDIYLTKK